LESADWWGSQGAEGVVLYAWGLPRYLPVARAIRRAGCFLVLNQDSSGAVDPGAGWRDWWRELWLTSGGLRGAARFAARFLYALAGMTCGSRRLRAEHLKQGDVIAAVTPAAVERYRRLCRRWGGESLAARVQLVPHPVQPCFRHDPAVDKEHLVVAVGRWDDRRQKRSDLLAAVIERSLGGGDDLRFEVYGTRGAGLERWHRRLSPACRGRVSMPGPVGRGELLAAMRRARVLLCTSAYESFHIAAAEALCCGCTVVAADEVSLPSFGWFAARGSGHLAVRLSGAALAAALAAELQAWQQGRREAAESGAHWCGLLHAPVVARTLLELRSASQTGS
jgi:glycosyltransferase involved in cell wall biosynthesis